MDSKSNRPPKLRKWSDEAMVAAYTSVKAGAMTITDASKHFSVPRMTLSDRVAGKVPLDVKMGVKTALTEEEESALSSYITYMSNRGFPLSIQQLIGFAWCIAKERKREVFVKTGPSRKWWIGFRQRHPGLGLRRPDALDRGRAILGNAHVLRDYFELLKNTLDSNALINKPECIYNCDEAALYLNKSAGQKVIVPTRTKHAHSVSVATNEHISVHCCVNAAGHALPPMIIFSKSMPGGAYHREGPVNASYVCTDSGFMDQSIYHQWFEKTFLAHAVPQRPLLLIQDGASSHVSVQLIRSAIANDVILLCLPPKTTHITQPLDVAVYRKMKIETAKLVNQAKMVKSDLWISKKQVSAMFKVIFEKSFTMSCITEGFRKCGIFPFDPNAIDKSLLLRSSTDVDTSMIDLAKKPDEIPTTTTSTEDVPETLASDQNTSGQITMLDTSFSCLDNSFNSDLPFDVSFSVGDDGILTLVPSIPQSEPPTVECDLVTTQDCPPELALSAIESTLTTRKKRKYKECYNFNIELNDPAYTKWRLLKEKVPVQELDTNPNPSSVLGANVTTAQLCTDSPSQSTSSIINHPLVKAGLIPENLVNVLVVPTPSQKSTKRASGKARVLTSADVQREIEEKDEQKKLIIEQKEQRKNDREIKRIQKEKDMIIKKEQIKLKKETREKEITEKNKAKEERAKQKHLKKQTISIVKKDVEVNDVHCLTPSIPQ